MSNLDDVLISPYFIKPGRHDPYTKVELRQIELEQLFFPGASHVWIGKSPPFGCQSVDIGRSTGYRCSATLHQSFDVVWCIEHGILRPESWPLLIDEAVRLIGARGFLVLRIPLSLSELVAIKRLLGRRPNLSCRVIDEVNTGQDLLTVLQVERTAIDAYRDPTWTIGILASGKRDAVVEKMLSTVRRSPDGDDHEIIIFGASNKAFDQYNVRWISPEECGISDKLHQISKKKNVIANLARHENLLICHDRYTIGDDFFSGFSRYGYDFDFVTVPQYFEDGQPFPSLGSVGGLYFNALNYNTDPSRHLDKPYVNGGFFVIKRSLMVGLPMNELCFWNQGEDVEYAETLAQNGVVPRLNVLTRAITSGVSKAHCSSFMDPDRGTSILLNFHRQAARNGIRYHWALDGYSVAQSTSVLDDTFDARLVISTDEGQQISCAIDLIADAPNASLYCSVNGGAWTEVERSISVNPDEPTTISSVLGVTNRQAYILFRIVPEGELFARPLPETTTTLPIPKPKVKVSASVHKVSPVRQPIIDFTSGFYGLEKDDFDQWLWASENAEINLLNPNPFPVSVNLTFDYWHIDPAGKTTLLANEEKIGLRTLVGGSHAAKNQQSLSLHLPAGVTRLTLRADGSRIDRRQIINDVRELSIAIANYRITASVPETFHSAFNPIGEMISCTSAIMTEILRSDRRVGIDGLLRVTPDAFFQFPLPDPDQNEWILSVNMAVIGEVKTPAFAYITANGWNIGRVALSGSLQTYRLQLPSWIFDGMDALDIECHAESDGGQVVLAGIGVLPKDDTDRSTGSPFLLRYGATVDFSKGADGTHLLCDGWSVPEDAGTWTTQNGAKLLLPIAARTGKGLSLSFQARGLVPPGAGAAPTAEVDINGVHRKLLTFQNPGFQIFQIDVPPKVVSHGYLLLTFFQDNIRSPEEFGLNDDTRPLGVMLKSISIKCE